MLKTIVVDDEAKAREVLKAKIRKFCPDLDLIASAESAEQAFDLITALNPELVFLDVAMPRESGFDLLKRLPNINFEVIFATGFDDFAIDAIKFSAIGYLLKPIQTEDLVHAVHKAKLRIMERKSLERNEAFIENLLHPGQQMNKIAIPSQEGLEFVPTNNIIRFEAWQKYSKVFLLGGKVMVSSRNLGEYKKLLDQYGFFSIHKSHLVNMSHILKYLKDGFVVMSDESIVPVSKRRKSTFLDQLTGI